MKIKCDKCDRPATVHMTEISGDQKMEKHLCEECAASEGITIKANVPITQLLEDFVLATTAGAEVAELQCDVCGLTFGEFRHAGVLGCPQDYDAFEKALVPMLERAHQGAAQHIGKVPQRAGSDQVRLNTLLRLRGELKNAIAAEDYERAAELRDRIKEGENS